MGLLWRLFAPRGLKRARRAMHPSWVLEDAVVRSVRMGRRKRRAAPRAPASRASAKVYGAELYDPDTRRAWRCTHGHATEESANRCADAMEERINRLGWDEATDWWRNTP